MLCRRMRLALPPCLALLVVGSLPSSAAEEVWKVEGRILGKEKKSGEVDKSVDVSGIACTTSHGFPRVCLVIDDNRQAGQFVTLRNKKLRAGAELPLMHDKHGDVPLDLDGEGVAYADGAFYVIGSHGRPRNFSQEPDAAAKALIDARTAASSQIVRIRLKAKPGVPLTRSDLRDVRRTSKLRAIIASQPALHPFIDRPLQDNGVTIEGIAVIGNRLFAGFRGPALENGRAPVLAVALNALFGDKAPRARLFLLPVGEGQGIRDLAPFRGGMLVLAGPAGDKAERYDVFWWDGASEDVRHLAEITEAAGATARHKPEAILPLDRAGKKLRVLILSDGEEEGAPRAIRIRAP